MVPDAADHSLDPGAGPFSVEVRFRTTLLSDETPNLLQKGQSGAAGGQVKLPAEPRKARLHVQDVARHRHRHVFSAAVVADGSWHVVRCDRTATSVTVFVDGVQSALRTAATGSLDNTKPWVLGGKQQCDARSVDCDYFAGDVDYVRLTKG